MDNSVKLKLISLAWKGLTKFEIVNFLKELPAEELKECFAYYTIVLDLISLYKQGSPKSLLEKNLIEAGYDSEDIHLIFSKQENKKKIMGIFFTIFFVVSAIGFLYIFSQNAGFGDLSNLFTNFDPSQFIFTGTEIIISGTVFGESTNFSDIEITTSNASIASATKSDNSYELKVNCKKEFTLNFSKKGFVPLHKTITSCSTQEIDIVMTKMSEFKELDLNGKNTISNKGVKLDVNGSDLVILGTNTAPKKANLSVTGFNPNTQGDMQYFPGELEGIDENGSITGLESYGFAKIIAEDEKGNQLDFKEGKSSKVSFKIDPAQQSNSPNEMPLWYFDETKGTWIEEGMAKKVCTSGICEYVGEITKVRSWHNLDMGVTINQVDINGKPKDPCEEKLDKLKKSDWWKKLKAAEDKARKLGKLDIKSESIGVYEGSMNTGYPNWSDVSNALDSYKINKREGNYSEATVYGTLMFLFGLRNVLFAPGATRGPSTWNLGADNPYLNLMNPAGRNVDLGNGPIDMGHAMLGFLNPYAGLQSLTDFGDALITWSSSQANKPDLRGNALSQDIANTLPFYLNDRKGQETSLTDFFDWFYDCDRVNKPEYYFPIYTGLFAFSGENDGFSQTNGVSSFDGGLFLHLGKNVYLSTTKNFSNSYSNPGVFIFTNFAYPKGNKLFLVTANGEIDLNRSIPQNEFSLDYNWGKEFYTKNEATFLLDKIDFYPIDFNEFNFGLSEEDLAKIDFGARTLYYTYENSKLSKVTSEDFEKKYLYENENLSKIIYSRTNKPIFEYNFHYKDNKLLAISFSDYDNSIISSKFNWGKNKLKIDSSTYHQTIEIDSQGKVISTNEFNFSYTNQMQIELKNYSKLVTPWNNYAYQIKTQAISSYPIKYENFDKLFRASYINISPELRLSIKKMVSNPVPLSNGSSNGLTSKQIEFDEFSLKNCDFWINPSDIAECIIDLDNTYTLPEEEALTFVSSLNHSAANKSIIYTKLAEHYLDLVTCYPIFKNDIYSAISCIKLVDDVKITFPQQNISNILNKNLKDSELSFVLRNLASYYADTNYCDPIPIEDLRNACFNKTPTETELETNEINDLIEEMTKINTINCKFDEKYSSPLKDSEGNYWIKEISENSVYSNKIAGNVSECNGSTQMESDDKGNITPCLSSTTKNDGCILSTQKVYLLSSSKENYTIQNKYEDIYKQNEVDFIDLNGNIWFAIDEGGFPEYLKLTPQGEFTTKQDVFDKEDKASKSTAKIFKTKPSKDVYFVVLDKPLHNVFIERDSYTRVNECYGATGLKNSSSGDAYMFGQSHWSVSFGYGTAIIGKDFNGTTSTKIKSKTFCDSQLTFIPFTGDMYEGYAEIVGSNFTANTNFFGADKYNNLLVLTNKNDLLEYYKDTNDIEFPSAIETIN